MEIESIAAVEGDGDQCGISVLPLDMLEEIFGKLLVEQISGCRLVCKEWNSILSSQSILYSLPAEKPWLLLCGQENDESWSCRVYCFSSQKWRTLSLSFLPNPRGRNWRYLATTAQGLLIFREIPTTQLCVCNPLTRSYAQIEIDVTDKFIHTVKGTKGQPYLVVCSKSDFFSFQIYHYFQDSWRIKLQFAGETGSNMLGDKIVECNGVLFWRGESPTIIVGYNIQDGFINPVTVAPLPFALVLCMVAYGSSVLVVETIENSSGVIIWELFQDQEDKLLWKWKEFARMPLKNLPENLQTARWRHTCICVGDYLCFSSLSGFEGVIVVTYNLKEGFWQCLPPCKSRYIRMMMSFEPTMCNCGHI